jgi:hypothetical protein
VRRCICNQLESRLSAARARVAHARPSPSHRSSFLLTWARPCELLNPAAVRVEDLRVDGLQHSAHLRHGQKCPSLAFWRARAADRAGTVHWAAAGRGLASSDSAVHLSELLHFTASCCGEARPEAVVLKGSGAGSRAGCCQGWSRRRRALHTGQITHASDGPPQLTGHAPLLFSRASKMRYDLVPSRRFKFGLVRLV